MLEVFVKAGVLSGLRKNYKIPREALASKLNVEPDILNAMEEKDTKVTLRELEKIAKFFKRHWSVFLLENPPPKIKIPSDKRSSLFAGQSFSLESLFAFQEAERLLEISEEVGGMRTNSSWAGLHLTQSNFEKAAEETRQSLGLNADISEHFKSSYKAISYWTRVIESKGIYISEMPMQVEEIKGFTLKKGSRRIIVINRSDRYPNRKIFSLIHELGHVIRDEQTACTIDFESNFKNSLKEEWVCNLFAGAFLLPKRVLLSEISSCVFDDDDKIDRFCRHLSYKYAISYLVVLRRLTIIGRISENKYNELHVSYVRALKPKKKSKGISKDFHPKSQLKRNSIGLSREVFDLYSTGKLSFREVTNILQIKYKYFSKIADMLRDIR